MPAGSRGWAAVRPWVWLVAGTVPLTVLFAVLDVPSPALFAGLLVGTALALFGLAPARVPRPATTGGQAVIGVVIGVLATPTTLTAVAADWLPVLVVGVGTLAVSMGAGLLLGLVRGVSPLTGMLALTAGGASGLTAISRDLGGDDRLVAVVQYLRVGLVTFSLPVVAALVGAPTGAGAGPAAAAGAPWWAGVVLVVVCVAVGIPLARLARLPAGGLLGPMVVALALSLAGATFGASPPDLLVEAGYAVIGWQAGVRFTRDAVRVLARVIAPALALIVLIVLGCAALGALLSALTGVSALEGYLATTPGGVYAVLAIAISARADVAFVVAVQILRVVVMLLVAPLVARFVAARFGEGRAGAEPA